MFETSGLVHDVLLAAGVRICCYSKPIVLHAKHFTVDDMVGIIGSSNWTTLVRAGLRDHVMSTGKEFVADLQEVADGYRAVCRELTLAEWRQRPKSKNTWRTSCDWYRHCSSARQIYQVGGATTSMMSRGTLARAMHAFSRTRQSQPRRRGGRTAL